MVKILKNFFKKRATLKELELQVENQGIFPAGHYSSPIPSKEEVLTYIESKKNKKPELRGININTDYQKDLLSQYIEHYKKLPFTEKPKPGLRYYYENSWFGYSDAIFLYCFLQNFKPKKIIEVGSGFSSAVMLDTIEEFSEKPEITFIEPYPDRLISLFKEDDKKRAKLFGEKIQNVDLNIFSSLESGDFLFVDSSHVVKCGSDLQLLLFEILPRLNPGVFVHFHDIFYPFDYPSEWLKQGRYWNEGYFLRAFLSYNSEWEIIFFNTYAHEVFGELIQSEMPLCAKNPGGSLYIRRKARGAIQ